MFEGSVKKELGFLWFSGTSCLGVYGKGYKNDIGESQIICNEDYSMPQALAIPQKGEIDAFIIPHVGMHVIRVERVKDLCNICIYKIESVTDKGMFRLIFFSNQYPKLIDIVKDISCPFLPMELLKLVCEAVRRTFSYYNYREATYVQPMGYDYEAKRIASGVTIEKARRLSDASYDCYVLGIMVAREDYYNKIKLSSN